nr:14503_t:CDS:2 [Entrophospora candida]CAG8621433.1 2499_t:CDS:2 [Entrophospora candida]
MSRIETMGSEELIDNVEELQKKFEIEIKTLASKYNVKPEFITNMMKDFQDSDQSKKRKICGYNLFQKDWWKNNKNDYNILSSNTQSACATEWNVLNVNEQNMYKDKANNVNEETSKIEYIENESAKYKYLNKKIKQMRSEYHLLNKMCGVEILSLMVSNRSRMIQSSFGTHIAEKFFRNSFTIDSVVDHFHAFSLTKHHENVEIISKLNNNTTSNNHISNKKEADIIENDAIKSHIGQINSSNINTIFARDLIRSFLKSAFFRDTGMKKIPYKNWYNQNKFQVYGWPTDILFKDFIELNESQRLSVLNSLYNIKFKKI